SDEASRCENPVQSPNREDAGQAPAVVKRRQVSDQWNALGINPRAYANAMILKGEKPVGTRDDQLPARSQNSVKLIRRFEQVGNVFDCFNRDQRVENTVVKLH